MPTYTINIAKHDGKTFHGHPSYRFFYRIVVEEGVARVQAILDELRKVHTEPDWSITVSRHTTTNTIVTSDFNAR